MQNFSGLSGLGIYSIRDGKYYYQKKNQPRKQIRWDVFSSNVPVHGDDYEWYRYLTNYEILNTAKNRKLWFE